MFICVLILMILAITFLGWIINPETFTKIIRQFSLSRIITNTTGKKYYIISKEEKGLKLFDFENNQECQIKWENLVAFRDPKVDLIIAEQEVNVLY